MSARKAKRHINESDDYLVLTRKRDVINVDHKDNDSLNIILDLAVANKHFLGLLKSVIKSVDEYTKQENTDKSDSSRPEQPKDSEQDEIQEAEVID
jgi:predicted RND superfamily exporter protein